MVSSGALSSQFGLRGIHVTHRPLTAALMSSTCIYIGFTGICTEVAGAIIFKMAATGSLAMPLCGTASCRNFMRSSYRCKTSRSFSRFRIAFGRIDGIRWCTGTDGPTLLLEAATGTVLLNDGAWTSSLDVATGTLLLGIATDAPLLRHNCPLSFCLSLFSFDGEGTIPAEQFRWPGGWPLPSGPTGLWLVWGCRGGEVCFLASCSVRGLLVLLRTTTLSPTCGRHVKTQHTCQTIASLLICVGFKCINYCCHVWQESISYIRHE